MRVRRCDFTREAVRGDFGDSGVRRRVNSLGITENYLSSATATTQRKNAVTVLLYLLWKNLIKFHFNIQMARDISNNFL